ncbi:MAG TPA: rhomboid family intramembrane serine protease [Burkholderiales bacterium]|nr:rhomboid family intramembrane serine protease [Burkholderiales bacterium]
MNFNLPPITRALLLANIAVFVLQWLFDPVLIVLFGLWPLHAGWGVGGFMPWQVLSYSFLHGDPMHLLFNMFALYMFGGELEQFFGSKRYLNYYLVCIVSAALLQLLVTWQSAATYPTIGASGGVFGLLLAFGMYFPRRMILLIIPPIPMPAWLFVSLYGALELFLGVTGTQAGVAHFAHLGGMLGGYLMIRHWRDQRRRRL